MSINKSCHYILGRNNEFTPKVIENKASVKLVEALSSRCCELLEPHNLDSA
ncbi:MAG: hypothetical protein ISR72_12965 [Methylobacter sp.]|nr:hypothetical protein [Methylobacter sp.]